MVRYHGVLAPAAQWRSQVVPDPREDDAGNPVGSHAGVDRSVDWESAPRRRHYGWARLMRRVFEIDVLECPRCGGRLRILAAIQSPEAVEKILDCLGLSARAPPIAPAAPEDNLHLEWA